MKLMARNTIPAMVNEAVAAMEGFTAPWFICGGWAIDLYLDDVTRDHDDIEIASFRDDQRSLRLHLKDWSVEKIQAGMRLPWGNDDWLNLPIHEVHAKRNTDGMRLEFLLNEREDQQWIYRRDRRISLAINEASVMTTGMIPVLAPQIVLLFKSKQTRMKDESDFSAVLPKMTFPARTWLLEALRITEPGHSWIERIHA